MTGTLSANANVSASTFMGGNCTATVSYSASLTDVRILRDSAAITDANNKCLPGELISLSVSNADPGTTYSWDITGDYFKNFDPTKLKTTTNNLQFEGDGAVIKNLQNVTYRYIKGDENGSEKKVTCTVKVGGTSVAVEDELKVYQPVSNFSLRIGGDASDLTGAYLSIAINDQGMYGAGMDWKGTTVNLPNYGTGEFGFAQTGNVSRTVYDGTVAYKLPASGSSGLDHGFLYGGYKKPTGVIVGSDPSNLAGDTPGDTFIRNVKNSSSDTMSTEITGTRLVIADSFITWLMFRSTGVTDSCWVPLRKQSWSWGTDATRTIPKAPPTNGAPATAPEADDFPFWTSSININQSYVKVTP